MSVPYSSVPCCTVPYRVVLFRTDPNRSVGPMRGAQAVQCMKWSWMHECPVPVRTVPYRPVPFRTVPYRPEPFRTDPYRSVPFRTDPYRFVLFCTAPYLSVAFCTV